MATTQTTGAASQPTTTVTALVPHTNAETRSQSGAVPALPIGQLADDTDSGYSSSDDGSVDIDIPGNRVGPPTDEPEESGVPQVVIDVDDEGDTVAPATSAAGSSATQRTKTSKAKGKGSARGRDRSRGGRASRGRGRGFAASVPAADTALKRKRKPSERKRSKYMPQLSDQQWSQIALLCNLLKPLADAQTMLEGEKYIPRSAVPFHVEVIRSTLSHFLLDTDKAVSDAASMMLTDFDERWPEDVWPRATRLAVLLDPRVKLMNCFSDEVRAATFDDLTSEMKAVYMLHYKKSDTAGQSSNAED